MITEIRRQSNYVLTYSQKCCENAILTTLKVSDYTRRGKLDTKNTVASVGKSDDGEKI